ncbi:MAG: inorganic phosphate transporter [Methylococcaceae bacterium]|nr:MAG: inorganic phosphate transporter [Methylococcaceae bacterium]
MNAQLYAIALPALLLAWANGANDVSKGIATLIGSGLSKPAPAILWGTFWTLLGGVAAAFWGSALASTFAHGYLAADFRPDTAFVAGALCGAFGWVGIATRLGLPVSTTHGLLGGIVGAVWSKAGWEGLNGSAVASKALLPLLFSPLLAIVLCGVLLLAVRWLAEHIPAWRPGCCEPTEWQADPFRCATKGMDSGKPLRLSLLRWLHWLSSGAVSFARGLNDVPKIAALLIPALPALGLSAVETTFWAVGAVTTSMVAGSLWGGLRVARVLAFRVAELDAGRGLAANVGTSLLVLAASPLGLPVSTTHVSTGSLMGVRFADGSEPRQADALRAILIAWLVTLPLAALIGAGISWVLGGLFQAI